MSFEYGNKWLHDRDSIVWMIQELVEELEDLDIGVIDLEGNQQLFSEGDYLENLYLLLEGEVELIKHDAIDGERVSIVTDQLKPGAFIGLIAFTTGNQSMTTARVVKKGRALSIKKQDFDEYLHRHNRLSYPMQQLMIANLVDRYQQNTTLQVKMEWLNSQLKKERNQLKKAYADLENTQNLLIHKEKMATLGQLVAGFAHEVNNPVSSLLRSSELLEDEIAKLFSEGLDKSNLMWELFQAGLHSKSIDTTLLRQNMNDLSTSFPGLPRPALRKLAQLPGATLSRLEKVHSEEEIAKLLEQFEVGKLLHNIQHASQRIGNLVRSLKNYSRQDSGSFEPFDICEGIHDTIQMLSNRLKFHEVKLQLEEVPEICGNAAELNQVWTNIINNACDAMEHPGRLAIGCQKEGERVIVQISDTGPGVPDEIKTTIFETNFTTKNQSQKFGLGLGLAISDEIVKKHNGHITVGDAPGGGAEFTVELPINTDCV